MSERRVITKVIGRKSVKIGEVTMFDIKKINEKIGKQQILTGKTPKRETGETSNNCFNLLLTLDIIEIIEKVARNVSKKEGDIIDKGFINNIIMAPNNKEFTVSTSL